VRTPSIRLEEWGTAFHEAGHVVAEIAIAGSTPDAVHLKDDQDDESHAGRTIGRSFLGVRSVPMDGATPNLNADNAAYAAGQAAAYGAVLAAGRVAHDMAFDWRLDPGEFACEVLDWDSCSYAADSDEAMIAALVKDLSPGAAEAWVQDRYGQAQRAVAHWDHVRAVAAALVERRALDRDDIFDLIPQGVWGSSR